MANERILVVDDEAALRSAVATYLSDAGYEVFEAGSAAEAAKICDLHQPHGAIVDYSLPDNNGLTVTDRVLESDPNAVVIVLTGHGSIELAVQAIKRGAEQFLTKPVELKVVEVVLRRALAQKHASRVHHASSRNTSLNPFIGTSGAMTALEAQARRLAGNDRPILLSGETGTGKTILARWLHQNSPRTAGPFVDLNCAGIARELLETELFGYEKGAYTGAVASKQGLFEIANRGTIFLDEIGDMDLQLQPKLLKVLEENRFRRVGDVRDRQVDVRLIAASHHDLAQLAHENGFRRDLYFRISTLPIHLVPLRERREDIRALAEYLLQAISRELGRKTVELAPGALRDLENYPWPGNIRELKNLLERAVLLNDKELIEPSDLSFEVALADETSDSEQPSETSTSSSLAEMERIHIASVLMDENGEIAATARRLGIARGTLYKKIKEYNLRAPLSHSG